MPSSEKVGMKSSNLRLSLMLLWSWNRVRTLKEKSFSLLMLWVDSIESEFVGVVAAKGKDVNPQIRNRWRLFILIIVLHVRQLFVVSVFQGYFTETQMQFTFRVRLLQVLFCAINRLSVSCLPNPIEDDTGAEQESSMKKRLVTSCDCVLKNGNMVQLNPVAFGGQAIPFLNILVILIDNLFPSTRKGDHQQKHFWGRRGWSTKEERWSAQDIKKGLPYIHFCISGLPVV
jgi:hypothetical protein